MPRLLTAVDVVVDALVNIEMWSHLIPGLCFIHAGDSAIDLWVSHMQKWYFIFYQFSHRAVKWVYPSDGEQMSTHMLYSAHWSWSLTGIDLDALSPLLHGQIVVNKCYCYSYVIPSDNVVHQCTQVEISTGSEAIVLATWPENQDGQSIDKQL